ncbi:MULTISPECIES: CBS domain-containing protein [unclassified Caballeronia]|uniref:CBS domain-containing protein n=1 Tax=unclassified Caballeronia TaxID=2646786 RepID=UPI0028672A11|nr:MULTISPECIES: CBS domain-containing protein [unclassified Caballeronia]MDR5753808.1 CBS domain-containing protein [Caballeronia sp. LZ024]MDR5840187.1 CBS domain-containing protein [Caballeronia sp. LZ031]
MATVMQLLNAKTDASVHTIDVGASVYDAIALMSRQGIGALIVTEGSAVRGIVTERDYARKVVLKERSSKSTYVSEIMSRALRYVRPRQTTDECMTLMNEHRIRHLPVIDGGQLVGMVSIGDLVKNLIDEQQFAIDQLERYVSGGSHDPGTSTLTRRASLPDAFATALS